MRAIFILLEYTLVYYLVWSVVVVILKRHTNSEVVSVVVAMAPKIETLLDGIVLGEGPHWDIESQSLYFVDITGHSIHKYVPATKKHTSAVLGKWKILYF